MSYELLIIVILRKISYNQFTMPGFNNNNRLQDHIMYALDWAIYLRHNIEDSLIPFLFEWEGETILKNMLQPGGDPEEFAYRIAEKSEKNSDQFVVGYEGMLTSPEGEKLDAFIIKGYDRTQDTGVFIAQLFNGKEKSGKFELVDKPMLISNPDLPFPKNTDIEPNYNTEELYASGMVLKNNDHVAILSHFNPSVVASGVKNFLRGKLQGEGSRDLSGNLEISIAPQDTFNDFFKYTITRVAKDELASPYVANWEKQNNKKVNLVCKHGEDTIYQNLDSKNEPVKVNRSDDNTAEDSKSTAQKEHKSLVNNYQSLSKTQLDDEFYRIASIPNARTNIDCLKQMTALMEVYESKGIQMPGDRPQKANKPKGGCMSVILILVIATFAILLH